MAIDPNIKQKAENIRLKKKGREVRESLAAGLESMSEDVVETVDRQDYVESQFQEVIDNTTGKDVISAPELIAARNGEANLKARLDKEQQQVNAQLAQNESKLLNMGFDVKVDFAAIGDGESHPLSERFPSLLLARLRYPHAMSLDDEIDWCAIQGAINAVGVNGGKVYVPNGNYLINRALNLLKENIASNNKKLIFTGESKDNVFIYLTDDYGDSAIKYDNGSRSSYLSNCIIEAGSKTLTCSSIQKNGVQIGDVIVGMEGIPKNTTVESIQSDYMLTMSNAATKSNGPHTLSLYSFGGTEHRLEVSNLSILNKYGSISQESWHPGVGLKILGARNSVFKNIYISGFMDGIVNHSGWSNEYYWINVRGCFRAGTFEKATYFASFKQLQAYKCGSTDSSGYGFRFKETGGITVSEIMLESMVSDGVIIDQVNGMVVTGGNIESITKRWSFVIKSTATDFGSERNYTSGVKIGGMRFWNSNGFTFDEGVDGVDLESISFINDEFYLPTVDSCVRSSANANHKNIKNVNYAKSVKFYKGGEPKLHYTTAAPRPYQSFSHDNIRYSADKPFYGGNWEAGDIVYKWQPKQGDPTGWRCTKSATGTDGSSDWEVMGQVGYRTTEGSPLNNLVPKFAGEVVLDNASKKWYKSYSTLITSWSLMG